MPRLPAWSPAPPTLAGSCIPITGGRIRYGRLIRTTRSTFLGSIVSLQPPGTNLDIRLLLGIIAQGNDDTPRDFTGSLDVQVRSSTNESSPRNILGWLPSTPVTLDSEPSRPGPLHATKLAAQPLDSSRSVYLYELTLHVPLQPPQTEIPEFVSIVSGMYNELDFWRWNRREGQLPANKPSRFAHGGNPAPVQQQAGHSVPPTATASLPPAAADPTAVPTAAVPLPEVRLSITREGGYLLITCSPVVTNAVLEETPLTSSPWQWRPVMTDSNAQTAGWYVPPERRRPGLSGENPRRAGPMIQGSDRGRSLSQRAALTAWQS